MRAEPPDGGGTGGSGPTINMGAVSGTSSVSGAVNFPHGLDATPSGVWLQLANGGTISLNGSPTATHINAWLTNDAGGTAANTPFFVYWLAVTL